MRLYYFPGCSLVTGRTGIILGIPFKQCHVSSRSAGAAGQLRPCQIMLELSWNIVRIKLDDSELLDRFVKRNSFEMKLERQELIDELTNLITELKRSQHGFGKEDKS